MDDFTISSATSAGVANSRTRNDVRALSMAAATDRQMGGMLQQSVDTQKQQTAVQTNSGPRGSKLDIYA